MISISHTLRMSMYFQIRDLQKNSKHSKQIYVTFHVRKTYTHFVCKYIKGRLRQNQKGRADWRDGLLNIFLTSDHRVVHGCNRNLHVVRKSMEAMGSLGWFNRSQLNCKLLHRNWTTSLGKNQREFVSVWWLSDDGGTSWFQNKGMSLLCDNHVIKLYSYVCVHELNAPWKQSEQILTNNFDGF